MGPDPMDWYPCVFLEGAGRGGQWEGGGDAGSGEGLMAGCAREMPIGGCEGEPKSVTLGRKTVPPMSWSSCSRIFLVGYVYLVLFYSSPGKLLNLRNAKFS